MTMPIDGANRKQARRRSRRTRKGKRARLVAGAAMRDRRTRPDERDRNPTRTARKNARVLNESIYVSRQQPAKFSPDNSPWPRTLLHFTDMQQGLGGGTEEEDPKRQLR